jgi:hypothetical protein
MTRGDHYNINCPYCSKNNSYATQGVTVPFRSVVYFTKECHYCKQKIEYGASWGIALQAEQFPGTFSKVSGATLKSGAPILAGTTVAKLIAELAEGEFSLQEICQNFNVPLDKAMEALKQAANFMNEMQVPDIQQSL